MKKLLLVSLCMLVLCVTQVFAQSRTVTGTVTSKEDGQPMPGVTVVIRGTTKGTQTDANGRYSVPNVPAGSELEFRYIGAATTDRAIPGTGPLDVVMASDARQLTEVVVTSFGIQRQAASLGYATARVTGNDIVTAAPISPVSGLIGKVSGLQISTTSNSLFAPTRILLRGTRSITGYNQPLIVVDGAIFYSDISTINPNDIQSTDILKGASASALYGSDASNGVIVITTKHGSGSKTPTITVSQTTQLEHVSYMPALQTQFGSNGGEDFVTNFNALDKYYPFENQSYGPAFNGKIVPLGRPNADGSQEMVPYSPVKNQKEKFFNTGVTTQQQFNFAQGDEGGNINISFQDLSTSAITPGDKGRRDVFRVAGDRKYGIFSATFSAVYTRQTRNTTSTGAVYNDLLESPVFIPVADLKDVTSKYGNPDTYYNDYYASPGQVIAQTRQYTTENHIQANLALNLKPVKWLNLTYRSSIDNNAVRYEYKDAGVTYSAYSHTNPYVTLLTADGTPYKSTDYGTKFSATDVLPSYGTYNQGNFLFTSDFLGTVNFKFLKDFSFTGIGGVSYIDNIRNLLQVNNTSLNFVPYNVQDFASTPTLNSYNQEARKLGYLGQAQFSYKDWAFLNGSYRLDQDSRLAKVNRNIPYYDVDGSVVLSEAIKEITENGILNFAKVRYAHSLTGNASPLAGGSQFIAAGAYVINPTIGSASGFPYTGAGGVAGYTLTTQIANPTIKPEKDITDEAGLDLGFLNDRIRLGSSIYKTRTTDGIITVGVSSASGFSTALLNAANSTSKGFELDLNGTVVRSSHVTWNVGVNWSRNVSKVNSLISGITSYNIPNQSGTTSNAYAVVGHSLPLLEGFDWTRDPANGKVIVDGTTGYPTRASTLTMFGAINPRDIIGITSSVKYYGFTVAATADYRSGNKELNNVGTAIDHSGVGLTTVVAGRQRFVMPNSEYKNAAGQYVANTNVEVFDGNYNFWPTLYNSVDANYVISGAAWKLREARIGYDVPREWLRNYTKFIKAASLSLVGRNLFMIRPKTNKWTDPEFNDDTSNAGGRATVNQAPPTRVYGATISVTF